MDFNVWNLILKFRFHYMETCVQGSEYEVGETAPDHDLGALEQGFVRYVYFFL